MVNVPTLRAVSMDKKFSRIVVLLPTVALVAACQSILDVNPHDILSPSTTYRTDEDAQLALAGVYARMRETYLGEGRAFAQSGMTDDAASQNDYDGQKAVVYGNITPTTGGIVTDFYRRSYVAIGAANDFLANVDRVATTPAKISQWKAEVRFIRALYYSYLAELYGGVPIISAPYKLNDPLIPRAAKGDVVAVVLQDLDFAIRTLPAKRYDGHATQGAAQALKARVLLANKRFTESADLGAQLIAAGTFSLYAGEYKKLFEAAGKSGNPEIIFSVGYKSPNIEHDGTRASIWYTGIQPTQNLVDAYEYLDGTPVDRTSPTYDSTRYDNRDPRLAATVLVPGTVMPGSGLTWWVTYFGQGQLTRYNVWKIADRAVAASLGDGLHSENDPILIRYAEVLLNYAEARNEAGGPDASVYAAMNQIRTRAGMPAIPAGLDAIQMRDRIRHERRVELAFEPMHRYMDIIRWHVGVETLNGFLPGKGAPYVFADYNHLWPIPQFEIDYYKGHGGTMPQNPGYN
ncbi:MAG: RagB/SusD family nutrient uptake outer membrane protein [Gemmatimonadaceae bacterium]